MTGVEYWEFKRLEEEVEALRTAAGRAAGQLNDLQGQLNALEGRMAALECSKGHSWEGSDL
jgi:phage shock protein A